MGKRSTGNGCNNKRKVGGKNIKLSIIGPAGENLVKYAYIINDNHHAAGRC
ncbi:MAG: aldehyde ferredoxin oxidoreductase N-terminal domain-containing protein [Promethearchaeota archaeon]